MIHIYSTLDIDNINIMYVKQSKIALHFSKSCINSVVKVQHILKEYERVFTFVNKSGT